MDGWLSDRQYAELLASEQNVEGVFRVVRCEGVNWRQFAIEHMLTAKSGSVIVVVKKDKVSQGSQFPEDLRGRVENNIYFEDPDRVVFHPGEASVEKLGFTMGRKTGVTGAPQLASILEVRKVQFVEHAPSLKISQVTYNPPNTLHVELAGRGARLSRTCKVVTISGAGPEVDGTVMIRDAEDPSRRSFLVDNWDLGQESRVIFDASTSTSGQMAFCSEDFERDQSVLFHCRLDPQSWPPPTPRHENPPRPTQMQELGGTGGGRETTSRGAPVEADASSGLTTGQRVEPLGLGLHSYDRNAAQGYSQQPGVSSSGQDHQYSQGGLFDQGHMQPDGWNGHVGQCGTGGFYQGTTAQEGWMGGNAQYQQQWNNGSTNEQTPGRANLGSSWGQGEGPVQNGHAHNGVSGQPNSLLVGGAGHQEHTHPDRNLLPAQHSQIQGQNAPTAQTTPSRIAQDIDLRRLTHAQLCDILGSMFSEKGGEVASRQFLLSQRVRPFLRSVETEHLKHTGNESQQGPNPGQYGEVAQFNQQLPDPAQTVMAPHPSQPNGSPVASGSGQTYPHSVPVAQTPAAQQQPCIGLEDVLYALRHDGENGRAPAFVLVPTQEVGKFMEMQLKAKSINSKFFKSKKMTLENLPNHMATTNVAIMTPGFLSNLASDDAATETVFQYCKLVLIPKKSDWKRGHEMLFKTACQKIAAGRCKVVLSYSCVEAWAASSALVNPTNPTPPPPAPAPAPAPAPPVATAVIPSIPVMGCSEIPWQGPMVAPVVAPPPVEEVPVAERSDEKVFVRKLGECIHATIQMIARRIGGQESFDGMQLYFTGKSASQLECWTQEVENLAPAQGTYQVEDVKITMMFLRKANIMLDLCRDIGYHRTARMLLDFARQHPTASSTILFVEVFDSFAKYDELKFMFSHQHLPAMSEPEFPRLRALAEILQGVGRLGTAGVLILTKTKVVAFQVPDMVKSIRGMESWEIWPLTGKQSGAAEFKMTASERENVKKQFLESTGCRALVTTNMNVLDRDFYRFDAVIRFSADFPVEKKLQDTLNTQRIFDMSDKGSGLL